MKSYDLKICMIFNLFIEISQIKSLSLFSPWLLRLRTRIFFFTYVTSVTYFNWLLAEVRYVLMQFASHQTIQLRDFLARPSFFMILSRLHAVHGLLIHDQKGIRNSCWTSTAHDFVHSAFNPFFFKSKFLSCQRALPAHTFINWNS